MLTSSRRRAAIAALVAIAIAGGFSQVWLPSGGADPRDVMLLYIGAEDCVPCRAWQSRDGAVFRASVEFTRISYREVKSASVLDLLNDENWPEELRGYRDSLGRDAAVPMWLVIVKDEIVRRGVGASQWREAVLPKIKSLVR